MILTINGDEKKILQANISIHELLNNLELPVEHIAVELNRDIVPKAQFMDTRLQEGDVLEIVRFVGGG